ncbi:MAG TPA: hypothetical protein VFX86_04055 [Candidatus Saccharimonadales bacterium]|nr:hypothetical protein [Candidatus Saccharimonadales bacterium]
MTTGNGEPTREILVGEKDIVNGHGITALDELYAPIEGDVADAAADGRRLIEDDRLFAPIESARKVEAALSSNGADPEAILARIDVIPSGLGITAIDPLFDPIEVDQSPPVTARDEFFVAAEPDPVVAVEPDPELQRSEPQLPPRGYMARTIEFFSRGTPLPDVHLRAVEV